jgi:hypothetical protein
MRRLRILFTNHCLGGRTGSELYVLDVCRALVARGHAPIAYSPRLGALAQELRRATIAPSLWSTTSNSSANRPT